MSNWKEKAIQAHRIALIAEAENLAARTAHLRQSLERRFVEWGKARGIPIKPANFVTSADKRVAYTVVDGVRFKAVVTGPDFYVTDFYVYVVRQCERCGAELKLRVSDCASIGRVLEGDNSGALAHTCAEKQANACLIAAALDLFSALQSLIAACGNPIDEHVLLPDSSMSVADARRAIARAKGEIYEHGKTADKDK